MKKKKSGYDILKEKYAALGKERDNAANALADQITLVQQLEQDRDYYASRCAKLELERDNLANALLSRNTLVRQLEQERDELDAAKQQMLKERVYWYNENKVYREKVIWMYKHIPFARIIVQLFYKE